MATREILKYSTLSKLLHWVIALVVIGMLSLSFFLDDVPKPFQPTIYMIHKSVGLSILMLMILRIIWIHAHGRPLLPNTVRLWEVIVIRVVQYSLYLLLLLMPLSGWIMSVAGGRTPVYFGLFKVNFPGIGTNRSLASFMAEAHQIIAWILIILVLLHTAGALKHHFVNKDDVLKKMLPENGKKH